MTYEFEYFHEPTDVNKPIKKLTVEVEFTVIDDEHPANRLIKTFELRIDAIRVFDKMGMDVTKTYAALLKTMEARFRRDHQQDAIQRYLND
jgi:hypothetical protein